MNPKSKQPDWDEHLDDDREEDDYLMEGYQPGNVRDDEDYDDPVWEEDMRDLQHENDFL